MEKDLYDILGIERFEDARGVQEAYRRLAKRYHPDCAGEGGTAKFREIQEAYEVLSDAQRRMSYDVSLARTRQSDDPLWDEQSDPGRASRLHPVVRSHWCQPLLLNPSAATFVRLLGPSHGVRKSPSRSRLSSRGARPLVE